MAVPKYRTSKARKHTRSSHNFKATANVLTECPQCHTKTRPHMVCESCGYYNGVQRIETRKERKDKKAESRKNETPAV